MNDQVEQIEADGEEEERTLFDIPQVNWPKFEKQMKKLSARSEKLGFAPIRPIVFSREERNHGTKEHPRMVWYVNILLTADTPVIDGWTFVARLDHSQETGNIIRAVPNTGDLPEKYRTCGPECDHCGHKRYRRDTFVLRCTETGEFKQVGSTCLQDFFGHDPYKIAKLAELLGYATEYARGAAQLAEGEGQYHADNRWVDVEEIAACAAQAVLEYGWVSAKAAQANPSLIPTRERAWNIYSAYGHGVRPEAVSAAAHTLGAEALEWGRSFAQKTDLNDYESNVRVISESVMIESRAVGIAVSIVGVFHDRRVREEAARKPVDRNLGDFGGVIAIMKRGQEAGLKNPKIRLQTPDGQKVVLSIAGENTRNPANIGTVNVTDGRPFGENTWFGRVTPDGKWAGGNRVQPRTMASVSALLHALATEPAKTAAEYGRLTGNCCFCTIPLTDERSTEVGYGPICAKKFGLPYPTHGQVRKARAA